MKKLSIKALLLTGLLSFSTVNAADAELSGMYIGLELAYKSLTVEADGVELVDEVETEPINILLGLSGGKLGDLYFRYTIEDLETENYSDSGLTEYGIGIRLHPQVDVGGTVFNFKVEAMFGDTEGDAKYSGMSMGIGGTSRMSESMVFNYGLDYYMLSWENLPTTQKEDGLGFYLNTHFVLTN